MKSIKPSQEIQSGAGQQNTQGSGQQFNAPVENVYINPPPKAPDTNDIVQAGVPVGKAFGARRSPTDATVFEFVEITHASQLNFGAPFEYQGTRMIIQQAVSRTGLDASRPQDGTIFKGVKAKVLDR